MDSIGEVVKVINQEIGISVPISRIRRYANVYLKPSRSQGDHRRFDREEIEMLKMVGILAKLTIPQRIIKVYLKDPSKVITEIGNRLNKVERCLFLAREKISEKEKN